MYPIAVTFTLLTKTVNDLLFHISGRNDISKSFHPLLFVSVLTFALPQCERAPMRHLSFHACQTISFQLGGYLLKRLPAFIFPYTHVLSFRRYPPCVKHSGVHGMKQTLLICGTLPPAARNRNIIIP